MASSERDWPFLTATRSGVELLNGGHESVGAVRSDTVTVNWQERVFRPRSVAVQTTVVAPNGNDDREGTEHDMLAMP